ncbi:hypothetical protein GF412_01780 [Candidatus Micrarchaeota archaeon]|nr:hypothetical protein [Candidatus Micrarchaeota archaeon]MBD3417692.1 hypothetical protein [Candidatus Micrarchaeota archaeon]
MIRECFLLLLVLSVCIGLEDPPVDDVVQHNQGISASMARNPALTTGELTRQDPARVNMSIVTVLPCVDSRIPEDAEELLWGWNENNADGMHLTEEDPDGCTDRYNPTLINHTEQATIAFEFRGERRESALNMNDGIADIPFSPEELSESNGTENLTVTIEWNFWYYFEVVVTNNVMKNGSCESQVGTPLEYWDIYIIGNTSKEFIVEPGEASFFLARPVLGEQWYKNNHFDTLVFSRKGIYKAEISMDGEETAYARIYEFTVMEDPLGAWHITANKTEDFRNASMGNHEISYWANPVVKENNSFSHLYEINHSYGAWGPRNMSITVTDFFTGEHRYSREILSRKLTKGGMSETGEPAGNEGHYRPGEPATEEEGITHRILPSNEMLVIFMIASLWMFWHYARSGK